MRDTKIVATLGPASTSESVLREMIRAGVNVVRINFSHGSAQEHIDRVHMVRRISEEEGQHVGVLADLQGPKIRISKFANQHIMLANGVTFTFDIHADVLGDELRVGLDFPDLIKDVVKDDILLLDDGKIRMRVLDVTHETLECVVEQGGKLSDRKGINKLGGGLSAAALTAKDMADIITAAEFEADFLAVSFPKTKADMYMARELMRNAGGDALLIAKIERADAIPNLEEILEASDGLMVARGDLAVEVGDAKVPALQKMMIRKAREMNKLSITATQMMESMITNYVPTRAEVSDVANAVLDGTDAVMLSAETAAGQFPVATVRTMAQICDEAEFSAMVNLDRDLRDYVFNRVDESIAISAIFAAHHLKAKAIAVMTESGSTPLWMTRYNTDVPIYAFSKNIRTLRRLSLYREVTVMQQLETDMPPYEVAEKVSSILTSKGLVVKGDTIVITRGSTMGKSGNSDTMQIRKIGG